MTRNRAGFAGLVTVLSACNVEPVIEDACSVELARTPDCPAAALVVLSDYLSTQVSLSSVDGTTLCESLASSARTGASGVALALSGDVVVPSSQPPSGRAVLLDRFGTNVVSWVDPETGTFLGQLAVGTGFESNPQDYVELEDGRAFVSRWGQNPFPGEEPFDEGGDLLVLDSFEPAIIGRIPLPAGDFPPRPAGMTRVGDRLVVTLQRASFDVRSMGEAELAGVDPFAESVAWTLALPGLKNCGALALSPSGARGAVACTGYIDQDGAPVELDESALVLLDLAASPPVEIGRFSARDVAGEALQSELEFASEERVLVKTQTALGSPQKNRLLSLHLAEGGVELLAEAQSAEDGTGYGVSFGGLLCTPGCGDLCLIADGDRRSLLRFAITEEGFEALDPVRVGSSAGLPPRDIGAL